MNPHIELVKKFLADNDSVTEKELRANINDAYDAWIDAHEAVWAATWDAGAAYHTAYWAYRAAYWAYWVVAADNLENAERYRAKAIEAIDEYEELTK